MLAYVQWMHGEGHPPVEEVEVPMIVIRRAQPGDADVIASLSAEIQADHARALPKLFQPPAATTFPAAAVCDLLDEPDRIILVANALETVVAYASAQVQQRAETPFRHASTSLNVQWMAVRAAARRQGVGRALVAALRDVAVDRGIRSLVLDVWEFNTQAQAFYRAVGFHSQRHILSLDLESM